MEVAGERTPEGKCDSYSTVCFKNWLQVRKQNVNLHTVSPFFRSLLLLRVTNGHTNPNPIIL